TGPPLPGDDGKDHRANSVHAPFSEHLSTPSTIHTLEARGFPACEKSPVLLTPRGNVHDRHLQSASCRRPGPSRLPCRKGPTRPTRSRHRYSGGHASPCREDGSAEP